MKRKAIIVDIDGTLSDCGHRLHHLEGKKKDWDSFYEGMGQDRVREWCKDLVWAMSGPVEIIYVTGRPEKYRNMTCSWLLEKRCPVPGGGQNKLFMRPDGDFKPDFKIKQKIYEEEIKPHYDVLLCLEERNQTVRMWRDLGLVCLQCMDGDY